MEAGQSNWLYDLKCEQSSSGHLNAGAARENLALCPAAANPLGAIAFESEATGARVLGCCCNRVSYALDRYSPNFKDQFCHPYTTWTKVWQRSHAEFDRRIFRDQDRSVLIHHIFPDICGINRGTHGPNGGYGVVRLNDKRSARGHNTPLPPHR